MINRLICGLLILVSSFFVSANEQCLIGKKTMFVFSNGMLNGENGIDDSTKAMEGLVRDLILHHDNNGTPIFDIDETYDFASAKNIFSLSQLYQVMSQRNYAEKTQAYDWLRDIVKKPDWVTDEEEQGISDLLSQTPSYNDSKLVKMVGQYMAYLDAGQRVIIIAHSQGNMYANMAYDRIVSLQPEYSNSIGVVSVASPDKRLVSVLENYTTAKEDSIINFVRIFYSSTLPGNVRLGDLSEEFANHAFVKSYLSILSSRNNIKQGIEYLVNTLTYPVATTQDGAVTIRLTWGDNQDVDLHVFEPGYSENGLGQHVYYMNKTGSFGELDVDNRIGLGPEHYNVQCEFLAPGRYEFGIDYYSDRGSNTPANYTINVKAGSQTRSFTGLINNSKDTTSNTPKKEGYIEVVEEDGVATYRIVGY
jgi:hypothetical protein